MFATDDTFMSLLKVLDIDIHSRISAGKFHDLFNIALVATGIKPATLVRKMPEVDQSAIRTHFNLHVFNTELPAEGRTFIVTWISQCLPKLPLDSHIQIGRELGYLRPMDICGELAQYTRLIGLEINFAGKKTQVQLLNQKVPMATPYGIVLAYLSDYICALRRFILPAEYTIAEINIVA